MIKYDDLARAARVADSMAEEMGFEEALERFDLEVQGTLEAAEQRALRAILIYHRRQQVPTKRVPVALTDEERRQMERYWSVWLDGLVIGLAAMEWLRRRPTVIDS